LHRTRLPLCDKGVDLKRRPPKSRPAGSRSKLASCEAKLRSRIAARRDSAVHVSLSSDSPVKQPGTKMVPLSSHPESRRSQSRRSRWTSDHDRKPDHRISVRSFEDAPTHRGGGVPNWRVYIPATPPMSTPKRGKFTLAVPCGDSRLHQQYRGFRARGKTPDAQIEPLCSAPLAGLWEMSLRGDPRRHRVTISRRCHQHGAMGSSL
jgi:hypothetical protein